MPMSFGTEPALGIRHKRDGSKYATASRLIWLHTIGCPGRPLLVVSKDRLVLMRVILP